MSTLESQYNRYVLENKENPMDYQEWFEWFGKNLEEGFKKTMVCENCEHLAWAIGVGAGLRCIHPSRAKFGSVGEMIPNSKHTCDLFEFKKKLKKIQRFDRHL